MIDRFERFTVALAESSRCWHKLAGEEMKAYGLKGAHATYLTMLSRHPEGVTVQELCEMILKDKSDASRMLAILEEKGPGQQAGRLRRQGGAHRTGRAAAYQVRRRACRAVAEAGRDLTEEERDVFYRALESITDNLRRLSREGIPQ